MEDKILNIYNGDYEYLEKRKQVVLRDGFVGVITGIRGNWVSTEIDVVISPEEGKYSRRRCRISIIGGCQESRPLTVTPKQKRIYDEVMEATIKL